MKRLLGIVVFFAMTAFFGMSAGEYYGEERAASPELQARIQREEQERKLQEFEEMKKQQKEAAEEEYRQRMLETRWQRKPKKLNF